MASGAATPVDSVRAPRAEAKAARLWAAREAPVLAGVATIAVLVLTLLPHQVAQDGWLSLVAGREVVQHSLPHTESLTVLGAGREWIDQQWLAHTLLYGAFALGGMSLVLALHATVLIGTFAVGAAAARRLGGSPLAVTLLLIAAATAAPWAWQLRAQTLALPLAVLLVWLLASDARGPSRRVLFVLPLLALWANLHGSVLLAAGLVIVAGVCAAMARRPLALALLAAPAAAFLSPYGLELVGYYQRMLGNRALAEHVVEWQPTWPGPFTAVFWILAAVAVVTAVRRGAAFERLALVLLVVAGASAIRNVIWLALAALVIVPGLLASGKPVAAGRPMRVFAMVAVIGAAAAAAFALGSVGRLERLWPEDAAAAAASSSGPVFADERLADWLLWVEPDLRGRILHDARFELLHVSELTAITDLYAGRGADALDRAGVVVLAAEDRGLIRITSEAGFRRVHDGSQMVVLAR